MMKQTIANLDKKLDQLRARKAQLLARDGAAMRSARTRQAIILGTWLLAHRPDLVDEVTAQLTRPQDIKAFGNMASDVDIELDVT